MVDFCCEMQLLDRMLDYTWTSFILSKYLSVSLPEILSSFWETHINTIWKISFLWKQNLNVHQGKALWVTLMLQYSFLFWKTSLFAEVVADISHTPLTVTASEPCHYFSCVRHWSCSICRWTQFAAGLSEILQRLQKHFQLCVVEIPFLTL